MSLHTIAEMNFGLLLVCCIEYLIIAIIFSGTGNGWRRVLFALFCTLVVRSIWDTGSSFLLPLIPENEKYELNRMLARVVEAVALISVIVYRLIGVQIKKGG
jgi:hypothetical protein